MKDYYSIQEIVKILEHNANADVDDLVWYLLRENEELRREFLIKKCESDALREANVILQQTIRSLTKGE